MIHIPRYYDDMLDWCTHDEDGWINGIREDAPEEMKQKWKRYLENREKARSMNEKWD